MTKTKTAALRCQRCKGNAYVDKVTIQGTRFDIACLHCGQRVSANAKTNAFARALYRDMNLAELSSPGGDLRTRYLAKMNSIENLNARLRARKAMGI